MVGDDPPYDVVIDAVVFVREDVLRGHDCPPGDVGVLVAEIIRESSRGFADDFDVALDGVAQQLFVS